MSTIQRCPWGDSDDALMRAYHDEQWGRPCHDEQMLFEMLILEGAQAGLSWSCILHKREGYRAAFDNFDVAKVAAYDEEKVAQLLCNPGIVRNGRKVRATINNAQKVLELGGLDHFLWRYVAGTPILNHWAQQEDVPVTSPLAEQISRDMKALGFQFVGNIIVYSYMQAIGMVNDHLTACFASRY
ncbi:MAG: DNA-3-methyladenine glycosylase I [Oscillospiraceae bacterium]|jgi:DNA-3-methyladenine glycosylase I|nr:DNA-3-methyladenine glycosylase I [Oscillospiraceae bacterium]